MPSIEEVRGVSDDWQTFSEALGEHKGTAYNILLHEARASLSPDLFGTTEPTPENVVRQALDKAQRRDKPAHEAIRAADRAVLLAGARHARERRCGMSKRLTNTPAVRLERIARNLADLRRYIESRSPRRERR